MSRIQEMSSLSFEKLVFPTKTPIGGMIMSLTSELTILLNALPMMTPTAMSMTLPLRANVLNSCKKRMRWMFFMQSKRCIFVLLKRFPPVLGIRTGTQNFHPMKKIRITVMRKACYRDLMERYENPIEHACDLQEGQVFIANGWEKPEGLCDSAWQSMSPFVMALAHGGRDLYQGWMKNPESAMISCNDGFRPVSFLIEVVD